MKKSLVTLALLFAILGLTAYAGYKALEGIEDLELFEELSDDDL